MPRLAPRQGQSNFVNIVSQLSPLLHLNLTLNLQALSPLFSWLMVESHWHLLKQVVRVLSQLQSAPYVLYDLYILFWLPAA